MGGRYLGNLREALGVLGSSRELLLEGSWYLLTTYNWAYNPF